MYSASLRSDSGVFGPLEHFYKGQILRVFNTVNVTEHCTYSLFHTETKRLGATLEIEEVYVIFL